MSRGPKTLAFHWKRLYLWAVRSNRNGADVEQSGPSDPAEGRPAEPKQPRAVVRRLEPVAKPEPVDEISSLRETLEAERAKVSELEKKPAQEAQLEPYQVELLKLQRHLEAKDRRMIVLFEGRDAAGKGGTIRRVTRYMNEKHYRVVALGKPSADERSQWYLQRYVAQFPRGGEMVLFDRSWYNRAMVEPVLGFCTEKEQKDFMRGVVGFEKDLVRQGTILLKLYFSVTKNEQSRRFERRRDDPLRQWKLSEVDLQAQELWDDFTQRKYDMLVRTHTSQAPWTIIRSKDKHQARLNAMRLILGAVDYEDRDTSVDFVPDPDIVVSGSHEVELMEADRIRGGRFKH
jgi:polyphosphate kinase 2